jgi:uncharacterized protein YbjT (DUF2867 family)
MRPILVTGGTGTLGRPLVRALTDREREVRVLSRRPPDQADDEPSVSWAVGDLTSGEGVQHAVEGVSAIVHCATRSSEPHADVEGVRRLLQAARQAGSPHLVYISIVGIDRVPDAYF